MEYLKILTHDDLEAEAEKDDWEIEAEKDDWEIEAEINEEAGEVEKALAFLDYSVEIHQIVQNRNKILLLEHAKKLDKKKKNICKSSLIVKNNYTNDKISFLQKTFKNQFNNKNPLYSFKQFHRRLINRKVSQYDFWKNYLYERFKENGKSFKDPKYRGFLEKIKPFNNYIRPTGNTEFVDILKLVYLEIFIYSKYDIYPDDKYPIEYLKK